ncbi:response regulator receiver domain-containing protein [Flavobacterium sp. 9]|uniref:response regulator transcription factor n=1 Tax=Flavobacterium sp. 9 TaxID=2035198 RepID=UPI000C18EC44|nr:response regulator transcription factor [Flavobacterium sp. 9]PIF32435.1 response regulator receiver domain-containing protein [Flavobacterium sp. 9]
MKLHNILWIEDDPKIVENITESFSEAKDEKGYNVMPTHFLSLEDLENDPHLEISSITMALICVDYNLPGGFNGNDVIKKIRSYKANKNVTIIFYSFAKNETELKQIMENSIEDISNIFFVHQNDLEDRIILILEE